MKASSRLAVRESSSISVTQSAKKPAQKKSSHQAASINTEVNEQFTSRT